MKKKKYQISVICKLEEEYEIEAENEIEAVKLVEEQVPDGHDCTDSTCYVDEVLEVKEME